MKTQRRFLLRSNAIVMNATALGGLLVFGSLVYSVKASAVPNITGVPTTISDGSQFTIIGSGFGTKVQAAPYLWDNFESGTVGTRIAGHNRWQQYGAAGYGCESNVNTNGSLYTNAVAYGGSQSSVRHTTQEEDFCANFITGLGFSQIYVSMYWNPTPYTTLGNGGVYKLIRMTPGTDPYRSSAANYLQQLTNPLNSFRYWDQVNRDGPNYVIFNREQPPPNWSQWNRMEAYYKHSNPAGSANGILWTAIGYNIVANSTTLITRNTGSTETIDNVLLPTMHSMVGTTRYNFYVDDVYIDSTPQRVEVCNSNTWAARTHCEPQIPSAWTNSSVTVSTNLTRFTNGSTVYVYVVDANNIANPTGFSTTVNTSAQGLSPPNIWIVPPTQ